ncbi:MAG: Oxa1Ec, partial [Bacteroidota bacterium]
MDRNTIIGLVLISGIVLTWLLFFGGNDKPANGSQTQQTTTTEVQATAGSDDQPAPAAAGLPMGMDSAAFHALSDSAKAAAIAADRTREHGLFSALYQGEDRVIHVQTGKYKVALHTKGGRIGSFLLNDFQTADSMPLPIQTDKEINTLSVYFMQNANVKYPNVSSSDLYFEPSATSTVTVTGDSAAVVSMKAGIDSSRYLEYIYTFHGNSYEYELEIRQADLDGLASKKQMSVNWQAEIPKTERTMALMREKTSLYYRESGSVDHIGPTTTPEDFITPENNVDWVAFHSQFFTHTLLTDKDGGTLENIKVFHADPIGPDPADPNSGDVVKFMNAQFDIPIATVSSGSIKLKFYAGPLDFDILRRYGRDMTKQIGLGWGPLKYINSWLTIPIFNLLQRYIANYGLIILLLGLIIKTLIYPLTYRTYLSTAKMRVVNNLPEVKELDAKLKDDPT